MFVINRLDSSDTVWVPRWCEMDFWCLLLWPLLTSYHHRRHEVIMFHLVCAFDCLFVCAYVCQGVCPDDSAMKDYRHTNNILQALSRRCVVLQVIHVPTGVNRSKSSSNFKMYISPSIYLAGESIENSIYRKCSPRGYIQSPLFLQVKKVCRYLKMAENL